MITQQDLIAAGYKPFKQKGIREYTDSFWQKRFDDENGKRYFITIAEYDNSAYPEIAEIKGKYSFEPDSQFTSHGCAFNITMLSPKSIEEMESFFENLWCNMDCDYYEKF